MKLSHLDPIRLRRWMTQMVLGVSALGCFPSHGHMQVTVEGEGEPTRILFVFDASNSMNAFWGGSRKIETASNLLSETLKGLHQSPELELGLRVYGHGTKHVAGQQDCDDTELVVPFGSFNNLIIKQTLGRLRAQGTTPIARSLEQAAYDFPDSPGRNVIVLITDGIEACDEDPCAVSRALQAKGIVVKPFVIGMGIEKDMAESLRCIGNFYDAADPEAFEHVLQLVLEQALHNTTVHVELLDNHGESTVTDLAFSFTDLRTQTHDPQWVHTMRWGNAPDTVYVDPLPTYRFTVHSLPQTHLDSVVLTPGVHNVIAVPNMSQGHVRPQFARGVRTDYGPMDVSWRKSGECESFFSSPIGDEQRLCTGTYDVLFPTHPPTLVEGVEVREGKHDLVEIPGPGSLVLNTSTSGITVILEAESLAPVLHLEPGRSNGKHTLQPGNYTLVFRARNARGTLYSIREHFTITSGNTTNLKLHG